MSEYVIEYGERVLSPSLQDEQYCDVELDDALGLRVSAGEVTLVALEQVVLELLEAVLGGLGAAVGEVLTDGEVGLVGVEVDGVGVEDDELG